MLAKFFTIAPLFALAVKAVTVTSPTEGQNWGTTGAQTVSWEAVSTDPTSFSVVLVNDNRLTASDGQVTLIANQSTSAGSVSVSPPSGSWTAGQAYRIRLVRDDAILASSDQFNITSSGTAGSSTSASGSMSSTMGMSTSTRSGSSVSVPTAMTSAAEPQSTSSGSYSGNAQGTGIPPSSTQGAGNGAGMNGVNMLALGGAGMLALGYLVAA